jgi:hypothetical protein
MRTPLLQRVPPAGVERERPRRLDVGVLRDEGAVRLDVPVRLPSVLAVGEVGAEPGRMTLAGARPLGARGARALPDVRRQEGVLEEPPAIERQERLVAQRQQQGPADVGHLPRGHLREPAAEGGQADEGRALGPRQGAPGGVEHHPHVDVAWIDVAVRGGEHVEAPLEVVGDRRQRHDAQPARGELERQRHAGGDATDAHHGLGLRREVDGMPDPPRPLRQQRHGAVARQVVGVSVLGVREARELDQHLRADPEALPRGQQPGHPRRRLAQPRHDGPHARQLLDVVHHHQHAAPLQRVHHPLEGRLHGRGIEPQRLQERRADLVEARRPGQPGHRRAVVEARPQALGHLEGEPGLAHAAGRQQRHDGVAVVEQRVLEPGQLGVATDEGVGVPTRAPAMAGRGGERGGRGRGGRLGPQRLRQRDRRPLGRESQLAREPRLERGVAREGGRCAGRCGRTAPATSATPPRRAAPAPASRRGGRPRPRVARNRPPARPPRAARRGRARARRPAPTPASSRTPAPSGDGSRRGTGPASPRRRRGGRRGRARTPTPGGRRRPASGPASARPRGHPRTAEPGRTRAAGAGWRDPSPPRSPARTGTARRRAEPRRRWPRGSTAGRCGGRRAAPRRRRRSGSRPGPATARTSA